MSMHYSNNWASGLISPYCAISIPTLLAARCVARFFATHVRSKHSELAGAASLRYSLPNCPDALAIRYAANLLGAATLFTPALANVDHQKALLARVRPTLLVVFAETVDLIPDGVTARIALVGFGADSLRLDRLAETHPDQPLRRRLRPDDLAVVVSSGGTTGVPKCSRRSFATYSKMVGAANDRNRRQLINGPLAYLSQVLVDTTLIGGGTVVLKRRYDPAETLATIESDRITDVFLVEPQLFETMDHPDVGRRDLSSLRSIAHIGGSAPAVLRQRAIARLGPVLTHMYGASETGLVSILPPSAYEANPDLLACAGRIRPGVEVRLRRADGTLARAGQCGNIEVRSLAVAGLLPSTRRGGTKVSGRLVPDRRRRLHRRGSQFARSRPRGRCRGGRWRAYQPDNDRGNSLLAAGRALCRGVCTGKRFSGIYVECAG